MTKSIALGGGCFWGMQELFRSQTGVVKTTAGYSGGEVLNPTYENHKGHAEVIKIDYDTQKTSFTNLLDFFFRIHNPTTLNRQGNDTDDSYRSVIFYNDENEKSEALKFIDIVNKSGRWESPVITKLEKFTFFTNAEKYHQDYLQKNPQGYTCHFVRGESYLG